MKGKRTNQSKDKTWFQSLRNNVLESTYWGRLLYIAFIFVATALLYLVVKEK